MKNTIVLGLCLVTTVSIFSVKNTKSNETDLGEGNTVIATDGLNTSRNIALRPTTALFVVQTITKLVDEQRIVVSDTKNVNNYVILEGSVEDVLSSIEVQDEMDSKMKNL